MTRQVDATIVVAGQPKIARIKQFLPYTTQTQTRQLRSKERTAAGNVRLETLHSRKLLDDQGSRSEPLKPISPKLFRARQNLGNHSKARKTLTIKLADRARLSLGSAAVLHSRERRRKSLAGRPHRSTSATFRRHSSPLKLESFQEEFNCESRHEDCSVVDVEQETEKMIELTETIGLVEETLVSSGSIKSCSNGLRSSCHRTQLSQSDFSGLSNVTVEDQVADGVLESTLAVIKMKKSKRTIGRRFKETVEKYKKIHELKRKCSKPLIVPRPRTAESGFPHAKQTCTKLGPQLEEKPAKQPKDKQQQESKPNHQEPSDCVPMQMMGRLDTVSGCTLPISPLSKAKTLQQFVGPTQCKPLPPGGKASLLSSTLPQPKMLPDLGSNVRSEDSTSGSPRTTEAQNQTPQNEGKLPEEPFKPGDNKQQVGPKPISGKTSSKKTCVTSKETQLQGEDDGVIPAKGNSCLKTSSMTISSSKGKNKKSQRKTKSLKKKLRKEKLTRGLTPRKPEVARTAKPNTRRESQNKQIVNPSKAKAKVGLCSGSETKPVLKREAKTSNAVQEVPSLSKRDRIEINNSSTVVNNAINPGEQFIGPLTKIQMENFTHESNQKTNAPDVTGTKISTGTCFRLESSKRGTTSLKTKVQEDQSSTKRARAASVDLEASRLKAAKRISEAFRKMEVQDQQKSSSVQNNELQRLQERIALSEMKERRRKEIYAINRLMTLWNTKRATEFTVSVAICRNTETKNEGVSSS